MSIYLLFIECVCESKFPTENYVWVSKIIHLLVVSAYRSVFIYLFFHFVRCTHTHIHIHPLYHLMLEYECCHTQYTCMTNSHCQYRRQPWTLKIFVVCFLFFGGVCGSMVMVTMENVSFQDTEWFSFRFDAFVKCSFPNFSFRSEEEKKNIK